MVGMISFGRLSRIGIAATDLKSEGLETGVGVRVPRRPPVKCTDVPATRSESKCLWVAGSIPVEAGAALNTS